MENSRDALDRAERLAEELARVEALLHEAQADVAACGDGEALGARRSTFLGRKGAGGASTSQDAGRLAHELYELEADIRAAENRDAGHSQTEEDPDAEEKLANALLLEDPDSVAERRRVR